MNSSLVKVIFPHQLDAYITKILLQKVCDHQRICVGEITTKKLITVFPWRNKFKPNTQKRSFLYRFWYPEPRGAAWGFHYPWKFSSAIKTDLKWNRARGRSSSALMLSWPWIDDSFIFHLTQDDFEMAPIVWEVLPKNPAAHFWPEVESSSVGESDHFTPCQKQGKKKIKIQYKRGSGRGRGGGRKNGRGKERSRSTLPHFLFKTYDQSRAAHLFLSKLKTRPHFPMAFLHKENFLHFKQYIQV